MAALRQRKPAPSPGAGALNSHSAPSSSAAPPGLASLADRSEASGWQRPTKTARRRTIPQSSVFVHGTPECRQDPGPVSAEPVCDPLPPSGSVASLPPQAASSSPLPVSVGSVADLPGLSSGLKPSFPQSRKAVAKHSASTVPPSAGKRPREVSRASKKGPALAANALGKRPVRVQASSGAPSPSIPAVAPPPASVDRPGECNAAEAESIFRFGDRCGVSVAASPVVIDHEVMLESLKQSIKGSEPTSVAIADPPLGPQFGPGMEPDQLVPPPATDAMLLCSPSSAPSDTVMEGPIEGSLHPPHPEP